MQKHRIILSLACCGVFLFMAFNKVEWGFYGHRLINRMAIFTLPSQMFSYYKTNLEYIQYHSIDPDKRRYASPIEGIRHYIDLDHWTSIDRQKLKQDLDHVLVQTAKIRIMKDGQSKDQLIFDGLSGDSISSIESFYEIIIDSLNQSKINQLIIDGRIAFYVIDDGGEKSRIILEDQFSSHGILPYNLASYQKSLQWAFINNNHEQILRLSAEIGHYIGDAHVPLHTTENYNGQLTGQTGIHAFWESRIPELFAEAEYDFIVDPAMYIADLNEFYWDIILESHEFVDDVLNIERDLRKSFPQDQQFCFDQRNGVTSRLPCREFTSEYQKRMNGLVEERMRQAIWATGSIWYTSWVNAGLPSLNDLSSDEYDDSMPKQLLEDLKYEHIYRQNIKTNNNE